MAEVEVTLYIQFNSNFISDSQTVHSKPSSWSLIIRVTNICCNFTISCLIHVYKAFLCFLTVKVSWSTYLLFINGGHYKVLLMWSIDKLTSDTQCWEWCGTEFLVMKYINFAIQGNHLCRYMFSYLIFENLDVLATFLCPSIVLSA